MGVGREEASMGGGMHGSGHLRAMYCVVVRQCTAVFETAGLCVRGGEVLLRGPLVSSSFSCDVLTGVPVYDRVKMRCVMADA